METRNKSQLLALSLLAGTLISGTATADDDADRNAPDIFPGIERRDVSLAALDTENFEFGISGGLLAIEDFESSALTVASLTYHITEDFFLEGRYGTSRAGETTFEKLSGSAQLLTDEEREVQFYDLSLGINLLPGEAFIGNRWAVSSGLFVVGGIGATEFAGDQAFTANAGVGYRVIANDMVSMSFTVRDRIFDTEITGEPKTTHNLEVSLGLSIFF